MLNVTENTTAEIIVSVVENKTGEILLILYWIELGKKVFT